MNGKLKLFVAVIICCASFSTMAVEIIGPGSIFPIFPPTPISPPVIPVQTLNDNFANRGLIGFSATLPTNWISGNLSNATSEVGEPFIDGVSSGQTVWGTWIAPSNGIVTLSANADTFSPLLTVYAGSAPMAILPSPTGDFPGTETITHIPTVFTNLSLIASNNYLACYDDGQCGCHWRERNQITFHVARGQAYQICVDSAIITDASWVQEPQNFGSYSFFNWAVVQMTNIPAGGNVQLGLQFTPAPRNDDFVNPIKLSGSRVITNASNAGATKEPGEPDHLGNSGGSSVWYSWTAPASGRITLSTNNVPPYSPPASSGGYGSIGVVTITVTGIPAPTCGNEVDQNPPPVFYPVFAAYTGNAVNSLTSANCLPLALNAFPNAVEFDAVKGQTYQIAFDGNLGTTGAIPLYLALTQPAANNNFASRIPLHGIYATATSYNSGATHQAGEPVFGNSAGKTVWWSWTSPLNGTVSIDLGGSDYAFPIAIFTGTSLGRLQMVAENSGAVSFEAMAGQTYQIAVSDSGGLTGAIDLKLQAPLVELPLSRAARNSFGAQLLYAATTGQVILLQRSYDGTNWQYVQEGVVSRNMIQFSVRPAPTGNGPYYRAVVVDWSPGSHSSGQSSD